MSAHKRIMLDPDLKPYIKIKSKSIKNIKVGGKAI